MAEIPEITVKQAVERLQQECNKYKSCARDCPYDNDGLFCGLGNPLNMFIPEDKDNE